MRQPGDDIPDRSLFSKAGGVAWDGLAGTPPQTFWSKWIGGVGVPLLVLAGVASFLLGDDWLCRRFGVIREMSGLPRWLAAAAFASLAMFLHFQFFWGNLSRLARFSDPAKAISAGLAGGGLIAAIVIHIWRLMW